MLDKAIDELTLMDYIAAHGVGDATPEGLELARRLMQQGDDYATAAFEVVARGLTTKAEE